MRSALHRYLTPPIVIGASALIALSSVAFALVYTMPHASAAYVHPTIGALTAQVDSDGTVQAAQAVDLSFQLSGKIAAEGPAVGTHVASGATLATLSSADLRASLEAAQAALQTQQAKLDDLNAGATPQSITVSQTGVTNAEASVAQARESLIAAAEDAYAKSDDAVHNRVDQFLSNPRSQQPSLDFILSDPQVQTSILAERASMEVLLTKWEQYLEMLPTDPTQVDATALASTTRTDLEQVRSFLDLVSIGLSDAVPSNGYTTATIQTLSSTVATGRTNVTADITALDTAAAAEKTAESSLASAQSDLSLTMAPATQAQVEAQEGQVAAAQANVDAAEAQLAKAIITAPFTGTITVNNAKVGQIAAPDSSLISMVSDTQFQFQTYVSQTDLSQLQVGQEATVELDAYQGQAFATHVIAIDPAATVQDGVSSYKVTLQFDDNDPRIEAGLSGNAKITTNTAQGALSIPSSAIITQGTQHFVIKQTAGGDQQVEVTTGISSGDGETQILSGLSAGDEVRTFGNQP